MRCLLPPPFPSGSQTINQKENISMYTYNWITEQVTTGSENSWDPGPKALYREICSI